MPVSESQSTAVWCRRFRRSPLRWILVSHIAIAIVVLPLGAMLTKWEFLQVLDGSVVIAQMALLVSGVTLIDLTRAPGRVRAAAAVLAAVWYGGLSTHSFVAGSPQWIGSAAFSFPIFSVLRAKGCRLEHFEQRALPERSSFHFSIRHLMIAATCVAVLFGLQGLPSLFEDAQPSHLTDLVAGSGLAAMFVIVMTLIGCIPPVAVWMVLTPGSILPRVICAAVGGSLGVVLIVHYTHSVEDVPRFDIPITIIVGSISILLATLLALRLRGYRVVRKRLNQNKDSSHHAPP